MFLKYFKKTKKVDEVILLPSKRFSFMGKEAQLQFQDEITRYFQGKPGFQVDFLEGVIHGADGTDYGLDNLAQSYSQINIADKGKIVKDHFDGIFVGQEEEEEILKDVADYNIMKKYIAVRLYPSDYLETTAGEELIYREDLKGILTVLVLDLPSTVVSLKSEQVKKWKVSNKELFEIGLKNTFANNKIDVTQEKFADNATLSMLGSDTNLFATASIYNLTKYREVIGKYGSLVGIPHRHMIVVVPINDKSISSALNQFIIIIDGLYRQGPGSISSNIYWYHNKKFMNLPYKIDEKRIQFMPPNEFVEILHKVVKE
jgi:hypothetical protein